MVRVLIACEESGVLRRAFAALGHDAWSCDLMPARDGSPNHIQGDVRGVFDMGWDLMIAHPPCTRLCNSGVRWLASPPPSKTLKDMQRELGAGAALFANCWNAPIARVAIENPIMHKYARALMPADLPPPQIVQPWHFGCEAFKATGLYTRGLTALVATHRLTPPRPGTDAHKAWSKVHRASPGPNRARDRSETFPGIAAAIADQWSQL